ncbi:hypothetical protein IEQ34_006791 [Dendrobium chrysotoxum]|uniref:Uncharacterized protein n=1 Tax=Dendrobium chrysotoxum TaxID=161865 RepID=A0AAV7H7J1_DENCH|nr:hypothetical protein IEQ34_006791 [Dendrobium chrysotoxum]
MAGRSPVNLLVMLLLLSNVTIARGAFGNGSAQKKRFLLEMKKTLEYLSGFNNFLVEINGFRHGIERVHKEMDGVLNEKIEEHEEKKLDGYDTNEDWLTFF